MLIILLALLLLLSYGNMRYIPFTSGMGNQISAYFARFALSHSLGQKVPFLTLKHSKSAVCRSLPDDPFSIELNLTHRPSINLLFTSPAAWETNVGALWTDVSESARQIMNNAIYSNPILFEKHMGFSRNEIIIHLRMSDVPFNRYPAYVLPKYSYWKDALKTITAVTAEPLQIRLITNSSHHQTKSLTLQAIDSYVHDLLEYLQTLTPNRVLLHTDGDADDDFMRMRVARFLICGTSSFSTMAALTGENERCILLESFDGAKTWPSNMLAFPRTKYALSHSVVRDYFDTNAVIKQLREE